MKNIQCQSALKCIDLFCGCGGLSLGFHKAGFKILLGLDNDQDSIKTFNLNFPNKPGICEDILNINRNEINKLLLENIEVDVIIGGPPCQGFSHANQWTKGVNDSRNELVLEFAKYVSILNPKVFLVENVKGMLSPSKAYIKDKIIKQLSDLNYKIIGPRILNSVYYGVPQKRERAFFLGYREGYQLSWPDPMIDPVATVKDAIGDLYDYEGKVDELPLKYKSKPQSGYQVYMRKNSSFLYDHCPLMPAEVTQRKISYVPQGGNWKNIPPDVLGIHRKNRHSSAYKRLSELKPSITIDTGNAHSNYFHPLYNRILSVREAARIQSFPDDFVFVGSRGSQYRQVGNAVPPLLAEALALKIKQSIEEA